MGWFIGKLKGGIKCLKDNGLKYTMRLSWQKVKTKAAKKIGTGVSYGHPGQDIC